MSSRSLFSSRNRFKLDLGMIYNQPDPRAYFNTLRPLEYKIPEKAKPVFQSVIEEIRQERGLDRVTVLDLGCSYGVNAWLLKYGLTMSDLYDHYGEPRNGISRAEMIRRDAGLLEESRDAGDIRIIGMDAADRAIAYALDNGVLDDGLAVNLEEDPLPHRAADILREVDLIVTTGCVGYITETTFRRLLDACGKPAPWVASFVLRMFPYDSIMDMLQMYGLQTDRLESHVFPQRQFASEEEQAQVIEKLDQMDIDPDGLENEGRYFAQFFLSRPVAESRLLSVEEITADAIPA